MFKLFLFLCLCFIAGALAISVPSIYFLVTPQTSPVMAVIIGSGSALIGITIGGIFAIIIVKRFI